MCRIGVTQATILSVMNEYTSNSCARHELG